ILMVVQIISATCIVALVLVQRGKGADAGATWAIVGHSERRQHFGDTSSIVGAKARAALAAGLGAIVCVGETLAERDGNRTLAVVDEQLAGGLSDIAASSLNKLVIAYEPVWAIGTGRTATPQQAQDAHAFIRGRVAAHDASIAAGLRILYGGSCKAGNAAELFGMPDVDGGLIGGASLKAEEFLAIWSAAVEV
ncbi:MAG: triose-phosphate isomerase, partial [Steroidobacteraceae bacterium]